MREAGAVANAGASAAVAHVGSKPVTSPLKVNETVSSGTSSFTPSLPTCVPALVGAFPAMACVISTRLKADDGGPMDIGGATLAAAAMRAGLIDEYAIVTHPVLVGGGTPFFTALDNWVNLSLVETRTFPDGVVLTRYETRR